MKAAGFAQPPNSHVALEVAKQTNTKAQSYFFFFAFFFLAFFAMAELHCLKIKNSVETDSHKKIITREGQSNFSGCDIHKGIGKTIKHWVCDPPHTAIPKDI